jgi:hypothetical protein
MSVRVDVRISLIMGMESYSYLQIMFLVDYLHQLVHLGTFWIGVLPELPWDSEGIHLFWD